MFDRLTVVAINGSPHGAISSTSQMIRMIGAALAREGIALEEIVLESKKIEYCVGCAVCLEGGKCWRKDDHAGITDKLFAADGIILASPVYFKHVTAQMKTFLDRSVDPELRMAWVRNLIKDERAKEKKAKEADSASPATGPAAAQSCHELLKMMPLGFQSKAAKDLHAVYQFEISETESFTAHLQIKDNQCLFHEGPADNPDVIIKSPAEVWMAISNGEMDGQTAFMSGKYRVEGDLTLLMKLKDLFQRGSP